MREQNRVELIDALRGLASLSVVFYHFVGFIPLLQFSIGPLGEAVVHVTRFGWLGVPVFFVLSGYVIDMTASRYVFSPRVAGRFILRRLARIAPPYWAMVTLLTVVILAGHSLGLFRTTEVTVPQVLSHYVYLQAILDYPPLDVAYWTLCLEVQFYLVFAVVTCVFRRLEPGWRASFFWLMVLGSLAIDVTAAIPSAWWPRLWYQFGAGVLASSARHRTARWLCVLLATIIASAGIWRESAADLTVALTMILLTAVGSSHRSAKYCPKVLLWLGTISYSLYLVHGFVGLLFGALYRKLPRDSEMLIWVAIGAGIASSIVFAAGFYWCVERPAVNWSRRLRIDRPG